MRFDLVQISHHGISKEVSNNQRGYPVSLKTRNRSFSFAPLLAQSLLLDQMDVPDNLLHWFAAESK
jgi:hypothetical protein